MNRFGNNGAQFKICSFSYFFKLLWIYSKRINHDILWSNNVNKFITKIFPLLSFMIKDTLVILTKILYCIYQSFQLIILRFNEAVKLLNNSLLCLFKLNNLTSIYFTCCHKRINLYLLNILVSAHFCVFFI